MIWIIKRILFSWEDCGMVRVDDDDVLKMIDYNIQKSDWWGDMTGEVVNHVISKLQ